MPKGLTRYSVLIPAWFTVYLFYHGLGNDIYYDYFHLTLCSFDLLMGYTVFSSVWFVLSPLKASCCDNGLFEILFYFFPAGVWSALYAAQYSIVVPLIAILFLITLSFCYSIFSVRKYRKYPVPVVKNFWVPLRFKRQRFFLATTSLFLVASFIYIVSTNGMDSKPNFSSPNTRQATTAYDMNDYQGRLLHLEGLRPDNWAALTVQGRIDTLQMLADIETAKLGIPYAVVGALKVTNADSGYSEELNQIILDPEMIEDPEQSEHAIKCLLWGIYNKYIHFLVAHTDFDSEIAQTLYFDKVRAYRDNLNNYIAPTLSDYDSYARQAIICDSTDFANSEYQAITEILL